MTSLYILTSLLFTIKQFGHWLGPTLFSMLPDVHV